MPASPWTFNGRGKDGPTLYRLWLYPSFSSPRERRKEWQKPVQDEHSDGKPVPLAYRGQVWMSPDFDDPLLDDLIW